jgi:hypothetical protein
MGLPFGAYTLLTKTNLISNLRLGDNEGADINCLMFGRAKMTLTKIQQDFAISEYGTPIDLLSGWAEPFLEYLGCNNIDSLDFSDYENAKILWNLNKSLNNNEGKKPATSCYDIILDYGTSEHVINPAMSIFNATKFLKVGGILNTMLPVVGWVDHGFFQFSPSFFYALDRPGFKLEKLYFWEYNRQSKNLILWDGLSEEIKEHVHGAFDGSFACNCFEFLNKPVMAWAIFRKHGDVDEDSFMFDTQQPVYSEQWQKTNIAYNENHQKLKLFKTPSLIRPFLFRKYLSQNRTMVSDI